MNLPALRKGDVYGGIRFDGRGGERRKYPRQNSVRCLHVYYSENVFAQPNLGFDGYLH